MSSPSCAGAHRSAWLYLSSSPILCWGKVPMAREDVRAHRHCWGLSHVQVTPHPNVSLYLLGPTEFPVTWQVWNTLLPSHIFVHLIADCWEITKARRKKKQHFPPTKPIQPPSLPLFHFPLHISKCPYKGTSFQTDLIIDSFHAEPRFLFHSWTPYGRKYVLTGPCFLSTQQVSDMDNLLPKHKEFYHSDNCLSGEDITSHCPIRRLLNARKCLLNKHLITLNKTVRELLQIYYPGKKGFSRHH